jgi:lipoprotein NlpI
VPRGGAHGRGDRALTLCCALELDPANPAGLNNLGIALYERKAFADALACYDRALALAPAFALAHTNRGNALLTLTERDADAPPDWERPK